MDSGCTEGKKDTYRQTGPKGGLFSESAIRFLDLPNLEKKNIPKRYLEI